MVRGLILALALAGLFAGCRSRPADRGVPVYPEHERWWR